jgi:hypothetical protein
MPNVRDRHCMSIWGTGTGKRVVIVQMNPDKWLKNAGKAPWELNGLWYWADGGNGWVAESEDTDFALPGGVYDSLTEPVNYPDWCRIYLSRDAAMVDFRQAFARAVRGGWDPWSIACFPMSRP